MKLWSSQLWAQFKHLLIEFVLKTSLIDKRFISQNEVDYVNGSLWRKVLAAPASKIFFQWLFYSYNPFVTKSWVVADDARFNSSLFYEDSGEPAVGSTQPEMSTCGNGEVTEGGASAELVTSVKPETSGGYFGIGRFGHTSSGQTLATVNRVAKSFSLISSVRPENV